MDGLLGPLVGFGGAILLAAVVCVLMWLVVVKVPDSRKNKVAHMPPAAEIESLELRLRLDAPSTVNPNSPGSTRAEVPTRTRCVRTVQRKAAPWLLVILAMAVLAGCSSTSSPLPTAIPSHTPNAGRLTGTLDDWVQAVCGTTVEDRRALPSATRGWQCVPYGGHGTGRFTFGLYPLGSESAITRDLAKLGPYAKGSTATEDVVFATFVDGNRAALEPLERFGFDIYQGRMSSCGLGGVLTECPAPNAPPTAPTRQPRPPTSADPNIPGGSGGSQTFQRFQSKTGNIACELASTDGEGTAVCEVRQHTYRPEIKSGCQTGWVNAFALRQGRSVVVNCYADTVFQGALPVQGFGRPLTVGSITCVIDEDTGVSCEDATTGRFFRAARQEYRYG